MTLATYSELVTEVEAYLNRSDYTPRIPTFVAMTEARLNRLLDDPDMEVRATAVATEQYSLLPTDFKRMVGVYTGDQHTIEQIGMGVATGMNQAISGTPRQYAIADGSITFAPTNSTTPITMLYVRTIPPLTASAPTNWLLTRAPDLYLYGTLLQAHMFGWFDERVPSIKALFDEAIDEMRVEGSNRRLGSAPLGPRLGRT